MDVLSGKQDASKFLGRLARHAAAVIAWREMGSSPLLLSYPRYFLSKSVVAYVGYGGCGVGYLLDARVFAV